VPVYLFTYHAYLSWLPDRPRGFVQEGKGIQPTNQPLAHAYRNAAKHEPFEFDAATQHRLIRKARAVCKSDGYRLHGASTEPTHLHLVISWVDEALAYGKVRGRIKNLLSLDLSRRAGTGPPVVRAGWQPPAGVRSGAFSASADNVFAAAWRWVNLPDGIDPEALD
jgi:hypothetical protein